MRFLIVDEDYRGFLDWLYRENPGAEEWNYERQLRLRQGTFFGLADFYSRNLIRLGYEAFDICSNNEPLQRAWASEHGVGAGRRGEWRIGRRGPLPWPRRVASRRWYYQILREQVKTYRPDVIVDQAMERIEPSFWHEMKPYYRLLIGQHAATPMQQERDRTAYGLVLSSFPPTVDWLRERGTRAELFRLGFEPAILDRLGPLAAASIEVSFVGSFTRFHSSRLKLAEALARELPVEFWAPSLDLLDHDSPIRQRYRGQAWGIGAYEVMARSRITLNEHGDVPPFANNMRLYEATGVGTLLLTDWKQNLHEMFEPGNEVIAYRSVDECLEQVRYYLDHEEERRSIARAGQARTLREHTYYQRMQELVEIADRALRKLA